LHALSLNLTPHRERNCATVKRGRKRGRGRRIGGRVAVAVAAAHDLRAHTAAAAAAAAGNASSTCIISVSVSRSSSRVSSKPALHPWLVRAYLGAAHVSPLLCRREAGVLRVELHVVELVGEAEERREAAGWEL
jgi:hypothetical protein